MSSGITATDTMAYAQGEMAWHKNGIVTDATVSVRELAELAGITWAVRKVPMTFNGIELPGHYFTVREDTNTVLGVDVGEGYEVFQNIEGVDFLESLYADGIMEGATAGSLFGGKMVYISALLNERMKIADDVIEQYMLIRLGHDGKITIDVTPTQVRPVCFNTVTAAINDAKAERHFRIKHTRNLDNKLDEAREALQITTDWNARLAEWLDKASVTPLNDINGLVTNLFGESSTQAINRSEVFAEEFLVPEMVQCGKNAYAAWNAITGYANHGMQFRERDNSEPLADRKIASVWDGQGSDFMRKGKQVLSELVTV